MKACLTATALLLATLVAATADAQLNRLPNGTFDTNTDGWTYSGPSGGSLTWEASDGSPTPGSLAITAVPTSPGAYFALPDGSCFAVGTGGWNLEARYKPVPQGMGSLSCGADLVYYSDPACTDFLGGAFLSSPTALPDGWFALTRNDPTELYPPGTQSIGVRLFLHTVSGTNGICRFDSVVLTGPGSVIEVPALHGGGLAILVGLLALSGLISVRRLRRGSASTTRHN